MTTLSVKNVKYAEFASEETMCFEATLYVDGKSVGRVSNAGRGGPNDYEFDTTDLEATIKEADIKVDFLGHTLTKDLDIIVDELVNDVLIAKDAKSFRTKVAKKNNLTSEQVRVFLCDNGELVARGVNGTSDDEVAADIGNNARRIDNVTAPSVTI
jgi:hypothetical protein